MKKNIIYASVIGGILVLMLAALISFYFVGHTEIRNLKSSISNLADEVDEYKEKINNYETRISSLEGNNTEEEETSEYDTTGLIAIKGTDLKTVSQNKTIVVLIARSTCSWCQKYLPIIKKVSQNMNIDIYYLDLMSIYSSNWDISDEDSYDAIYNIATNSDMKSYMAENFGSTPQTLIIKNNTLIDALPGYTTEEELTSFLQEYFK